MRTEQTLLVQVSVRLRVMSIKVYPHTPQISRTKAIPSDTVSGHSFAW